MAAGKLCLRFVCFCLVFLIQVENVSADCSVYRTLEGVRVQNNPLATWTFQAQDRRRNSKCEQKCAETSGCLAFLVDVTSCSVYNVTLMTSQGLVTSPGSGVLFYEISGNDWFPVLKISAGKKSRFYDLWTGNESTADVTSCHVTPELSCATHYKHPVVEFWEQLRINQIKVSIYKLGAQVLSLAFYGYTTNKTNFWSSQNLKTFRRPTIWTNSHPSYRIRLKAAGSQFHFTGSAGGDFLFGVWGGELNAGRDEFGYKVFPQIRYSPDGAGVPRRDPDLVFHMRGDAGVYSLTKTQAHAACASVGAVMATYVELEAAWRNGMSVCACGFVSDRTYPWYPMNEVIPDCGNSAQMQECVSNRADVFCIYRQGTSREAELADTLVVSIR